MTAETFHLFFVESADAPDLTLVRFFLSILGISTAEESTLGLCLSRKLPASSSERLQVMTTSVIVRRFRKVRRRIRPMETFRDKTSMQRILHAVFIHEPKSQGTSTPVSLIHDS